MKKRFYGILLLGAMMVASMSTFTSCTDYDDDIKNLQEQIDAQKKSLSDMQGLIQAGSVITGLDKAAGGVTVTLSNGQTFTITNGIDGKDGKDGIDGVNGIDGTVWTISDDGYWVKDGVKTEYQALGRDGKDGKDGVDGKDGKDGVDGKDGIDGKDGKDGIDGKDGVDGKDGKDGIDGKDGKDGINGKDGKDGKDGVDGKDGLNGKDGKDGVNGTGSTPTIQIIDGYWYINGEKSIKATGEDGKPGASPTIEIKDGYWYVNGEKLCKATGENGANGSAGIAGLDGLNGSYYYPGPNGYFIEYKWNAETKTYEPKETTISYLVDNSDVVSAVWDTNNGTLTLGNVITANGAKGIVTISLSSDQLTSLVFITGANPDTYKAWDAWKAHTFFLDGIETIEYPWVADTILHESDHYGYKQTTHHKKIIKDTEEIFDYIPNTLVNPTAQEYGYPNDSKKEGLKFTAKDKWIYGPVWGVDYHLNPANYASDYKTASPKFNVLEPEVVYTRAAAKTLNVTSPEKNGAYSEDHTIFAMSKGIVTAGLKIAKPQYLEPYPTILKGLNGGGTAEDAGVETYPGWYDWYENYGDDDASHYDNTIALQMKDKASGDYVTSDYALLIPARIELEGLVWNIAPNYAEPKFGPNIEGQKKVRIGDENGWANECTEKRIHVYDSPEEALNDNDGAALELPIENSTIALRDYLGIHYVKENVISRKFEIKTMAAKTYDEELWGLHYEFEFVDYETSTNVTRDSRYATFTDFEEVNWSKYPLGSRKRISLGGVVQALNVNQRQEVIGTASETATDREPLVRVMVKNDDGDVLLDGYILIHITTTPKNLIIDNYPAQNKEFDNCNVVDFLTNWAQFSKYVLTDKMKDFKKESFDLLYYADCIEDTEDKVRTADKDLVTPNALLLGLRPSDGNGIYSMKIFNFGDKYGLDKDGNVAMPEERGNQNGKEETKWEFENAPLGVVWFYPNHDGPTNHKWVWELQPDEVEYLTHDKKAEEYPVKVVRWIRFKAKNYTEAANVDVDNYMAPYPYVWVKLTLLIDRDREVKALYTEKNDNYWYNWNTGASTGWSGYLLDIQAPRNGVTIKDQLWENKLSDGLIGNKVQIDRYCKYFFAPIVYTIDVEDPVTHKVESYEITPAKSSTDAAWKTLYCKYVDLIDPHKRFDSHILKNFTGVDAGTTEDKLAWDSFYKTVAQNCAIDYNKGVFENTILYAHKVGSTGDYTPIAWFKRDADGNPMNEQDLKKQATWEGAGAIQLIHWLKKGTLEPSEDETDDDNIVCYKVLNAIGYAANNANINKQLRGWVSVVANNGCDVAKYVEQEKYDDNHAASFLVSWERPINLQKVPVKSALDANTNENYLVLIKDLKLYDWRGDWTNQGYMYDMTAKNGGSHYWFWGYYNVKSIRVDMRPASVLTTMHKDQRPAGKEWVPLNEVTTQATLVAYKVNDPGFNGTAYIQPGAYPSSTDTEITGTYVAAESIRFEFDLTSYSDSYKENDLKKYIEEHRKAFGMVYYANNGENVTDFSLKIPVQIGYEWGYIDGVIQWDIQTTHGH